MCTLDTAAKEGTVGKAKTIADIAAKSISFGSGIIAFSLYLDKPPGTKTNETMLIHTTRTEDWLNVVADVKNVEEGLACHSTRFFRCTAASIIVYSYTVEDWSCVVTQPMTMTAHWITASHQCEHRHKVDSAHLFHIPS